MDIECKLKREGGTHVDMGSDKYHFAPRADGAHVADVADERHQDRFLSIPEAYRVYRGEAAAAPVAPAPAAEPAKVAVEPESPAADILLGSDEHPASFTIHGTTYSLGDIVARAQKSSGLDVNEWNALADASRADMIDDALDELTADTNGDGAVDNAEERAALVDQFVLKFGKKPHHNAGVESIRAKLAEA